jgi:hypothetical protein
MLDNNHSTPRFFYLFRLFECGFIRQMPEKGKRYTWASLEKYLNKPKGL